MERSRAPYVKLARVASALEPEVTTFLPFSGDKNVKKAPGSLLILVQANPRS